MRNTTRPGQPVSFSIDKLRLTGTVERINGDWVHVRANGSLYKVHRLRAKDVLTCIVCGGPRTYNSRRYCSTGCQTVESHRDNDAWTLQAIIEFKTEFDGCAPSLQEIVNRSGLTERTVREAMNRLEQAGRIKVVGKDRHWGIVVPGGRWVYEGKQA